MEHHASLPFLNEVLLFLTLAGILIPLLQRFRINQVVAFLAVGIMVGPHGLTTWSDHWPWLSTFTFPNQVEVEALAELGVIFLMFLIGLELSVERMWAMRHWVFMGGMAQIGLCSCVIALIAYGFGNALEIALILGLVLSLSSTAVVIQLLAQRRGLGTPVGQAAFAVLMMQDLAVVPLLVLVELLARGSSDNFSTLIALTLLKSTLVVVVLFIVGRRVVGPGFRFFAKQRQPEVFMALTLLITLGIAGATAAAGLSMALGALLAGLLLAETEYRHEVEITIEPFKGLLMGLFFMTVGMGIDIRALFHNLFWVLLSVIGLMGIKTLITAIILQQGRLSWAQALEGGLLLSQGGEFAFIVIGYAASMGLLQEEVSQFVLLVVSLTLLLTPPAALMGTWISAKFTPVPSDNLSDLPATQPTSGHIVIAGMGRVGQLLACVFRKQGIPYLGIEQDALLVYKLRSQGEPVSYGDAAKTELLHKLHTESAQVLIVTMDQPTAAIHTVQTTRARYPHLPILVRSRDEQHAAALKQAGATAVVPETLEAALQLSAFALQALGLPETQINNLLEQEREIRIQGHN